MINLAEVPLQPAGPTMGRRACSPPRSGKLVRFVGPMARILVRQAAGQAHDTRELYAILADHIADPDARERFAPVRHDRSQRLAHASVTTDDVRGRTRRARAVAATTAGGRTRTPRPLEQAFIDQTTSRLAVYLGPIAKVVARKAAQKAHDSDEFLQLVAEHIGTQERERSCARPANRGPLSKGSAIRGVRYPFREIFSDP